MYFERLCELLKELPEVEAIALGGSRAGTVHDEKSDYDLYIYCTAIPAAGTRRAILEQCCNYMELGNQFWEFEDDCTLKDGIDIDILYRNLQEFGEGIHRVVDEYAAYNGYTTCMWHNLLNSKIIYDPDGKYENLQNRYRVPYPKALKQNIIEKNLKLLSGMLPSYDLQIKKAITRGDLVSMNHRVTAFMESYFDIIFALNEMTHPGEKRLVSIAAGQAAILPTDFEKNIEKLYKDLFTVPENVMNDISLLIENLREVLRSFFGGSSPAG